jgi:RNA polymerase sigma-70 factor (ECF subfamily)
LGTPRRPSPAPHAWLGLEEHRPHLHRRLRARCRDENEVEDLVQETFLRAARYRGSLSDPARLRSWLLQIAGNVHRDHLQRERRFRVCPPDEGTLAELEGREEAPGDAEGDPVFELGCHVLELLSARRHVDAALAELEAHDRELLEGYYGEDGGTRAAAARVGLPPGAVKVRLFRARRRLRRAVGRVVQRQRAVRPAWAEVGA